jgi:hypothetical protein
MQLATSDRHHGISMVRVVRAALKRCAARTRKRASALDRAPDAKQVAMMPLWLSEWCPRILVDQTGSHVRTLSFTRRHCDAFAFRSDNINDELRENWLYSKPA